VSLTTLEGSRVPTQKFTTTQFGCIAPLHNNRVDMFRLLTAQPLSCTIEASPEGLDSKSASTIDDSNSSVVDWRLQALIQTLR
jgi:hypothetical protein